MTEFARRFSIALYDKGMKQYDVAMKAGCHGEEKGGKAPPGFHNVLWFNILA